MPPSVNTAKQTTEQNQVAAQGGAAGSVTNAIGATKGTGAVGANATGNITGGVRGGNVSRGGSQTINIVSSDVYALQASTAVATEALHDMTAGNIAALQANQNVSQDAINFANINANAALQLAQNLAGVPASQSVNTLPISTDGSSLSTVASEPLAGMDYQKIAIVGFSILLIVGVSIYVVKHS